MDYKLKDLVINEYYYMDYNNNQKYIFKHLGENYNNNSAHYIMNLNSFYLNCINFSASFPNCRLATNEERQWLDECIEAGKFISLEESLKLNYYEIY